MRAVDADRQAVDDVHHELEYELPVVVTVVGRVRVVDAPGTVDDEDDVERVATWNRVKAILISCLCIFE